MLIGVAITQRNLIPSKSYSVTTSQVPLHLIETRKTVLHKRYIYGNFQHPLVSSDSVEAEVRYGTSWSISCEAVNFPISLSHTTIMRSRMEDVPCCSRLSTHVSSSHSADVLIVCAKH